MVVDKSNSFYNEEKKDALGFSNDVELLILGSLYYCGWDTAFDFIETKSEADAEVHGTFHHQLLCQHFYDVKSEYIYLPRDV